MMKIKEIDLKEESGNINAILRKERCDLKNTLEDLILKEEISWKQKARVKWVREWDNNSKLFHKIVNMKKGSKLIKNLEKDNRGNFGRRDSDCEGDNQFLLVLILVMTIRSGNWRV